MSDLVDQIDALLALNAKGAVSHPVPGLAVELLERAKLALTFPAALSLGHPIQGEADAVAEVGAFVRAVQLVEDAGWLVMRPEQVASQSPTPAGVREITEEERVLPELLTEDERISIMRKAEVLWEALQQNNLGGYSGVNRPFYILHAFKEVIEEYGRRDVGLSWSKNDLDAALAAAKEAGE